MSAILSNVRVSNLHTVDLNIGELYILDVADILVRDAVQ